MTVISAFRIFFYISFFLFPVITVLLFQINSPKDIYFFTDILVLPAMYQDLLDSFPFSGWSFTPSPYFFPDMVLYFPVRFFSSTFQASMYFYGIVQVLLLFGFSVLIIRTVFPADSFLFSLSAGYILMNLCLRMISEFRPFAIILIPTVHFGAYIVLLACLLYWLKNFKAGYVIPVLTVIAGVSDRLFHVIFSLPFALSWIIILRSNQEKKENFFSREFQIWKPAVRSILVSVLISVLAYNALKSFIKIEAVSRVSADISFRMFVGSILSLYSKGGISAKILFAGFLPAYFICLIYYIRNRKYIDTKPGFFLLFSLISVPLTLSAPVIAGTFLDEYSFRYSVFSFFLLYCSFFLVLHLKFRDWLSEKYPGKLERLFPIPAAVLCIILMIEVILKIDPDHWNKMNANFSYVPEEVKCAERIFADQETVYGLSDYWNAKYYTLFSKNRLRIYQIGYQDLKKNHTLNNKYWYEKGKSVKFGSPEYKFIITERISEALIEKKWGKPDHKTDCGRNRVWIYRSGISLD